MKTILMHCAAFLLLIVFVCSPVWATCGGGGGGGGGGMSGSGGSSPTVVYHVPWKIRDAKTPAVTQGLVLYWFPATREEIQNSSLRESRDLSLYAGQCVAMELADGSHPYADTFMGSSKLPIAVLATPDGTLVSKLDNKDGKLKVQDVEKLVGGEIKTRKSKIETNLKEAKDKAAKGEKDAAIEVFQSVIKQKCMFPDKAKEASKELKKLGVETAEKIPATPNFDAALSAKIVKIMKDGLAAENNANYLLARKLYTEARNLDLADPTPLRYLAELNRHQIGNWEQAKTQFRGILQMQADPLSRAVAFHGLGKITIHEGQFKKGLGLMEQSAATYPISLTYRNLAVYWNSEGDLKKANEYTDKAVLLDPTDPYNLIFAAVYLAQNGKKAEALKIANDNINFLAASYNLAAIYALNGQKEKALELLKRHFYEYERFHNVRTKEMMEARVDAVFVSLWKDKDFVALTRFADGKLPLPMSVVGDGINR